MIHHIDCMYECDGCKRIFCDIKTIEELPHEIDLDQSARTGSGNRSKFYCRTNCFRFYKLNWKGEIK